MAFNVLAVEINEHIASYLSTDKDLSSFSLVCRETYNAINSSHSGIWRKFFARSFDLPPGKTSHELQVQYRLRKKKLAGFFPFTAGHTNEEQRYLELLRELIVESFVDPPVDCTIFEKPASKNLNHLRVAFRRTTLLDGIFRPRTEVKIDSFLVTIQLILSYRSLIIFPRIHQTYGFPVSQHVVYAHPKAAPMFLDKYMRKVNVEYLLHIVNFFKYHMTREEEGTLYSFLCDLEDTEKPRPWQGRLMQGVELIGTSWKGSYAYLHNLKDMRRIRSHIPCDSIIYSDTLDLDNGFQTLELDFSSAKQTLWPALLEHHLASLPSPSLAHALKTPHTMGSFPPTEVKHLQDPVIGKEHLGNNTLSKITRMPLPPTSPTTPATTHPSASRTAGPVSTAILPPPTKGIDYTPFTGLGIDAAPFNCIGNIHALPPQHGIPGWQRITMMKHFDLHPTYPNASNTTTASPSSAASDGDDEVGPDWHDPDLIALGNCWAYEGVVLPGGMMMLGRWWSPGDEGPERLCTGPWIFWRSD